MSNGKKQPMANQIKWPLRYQLYYDPEFDYRTVHHKHVGPMRNSRTGSLTTLGQYIEYLKLNIQSDGLKNPVQVTYQNDQVHIHPGKSRVAALKELKIDTVPAIIVDYSNDYKGNANSLKPEDSDALLCNDCIAEYAHRFFNIKKRPHG